MAFAMEQLITNAQCDKLRGSTFTCVYYILYMCQLQLELEDTDTSEVVHQFVSLLVDSTR